MDLLYEILLEIYLEFWTILVPEHKFKKWQETLLKITCIVVSLIILALIGAGICILVETSMRTLGIILLAVGCVLFFTQIVLFIIVLTHQIKKEKAEKTLPSSDNDSLLNN